MVSSTKLKQNARISVCLLIDNRAFILPIHKIIVFDLDTCDYKMCQWDNSGLMGQCFALALVSSMVWSRVSPLVLSTVRRSMKYRESEKLYNKALQRTDNRRHRFGRSSCPAGVTNMVIQAIYTAVCP